MLPAATTERPALDRSRSAALAVGALAGCAVVALVDPGEAGRYPSCPSAALLGMDCPVCGTLRGVHALSRGRVVQALDHNLLLAVAVPLAAVAWWGWVRGASGRPARPRRWPIWATPVAVVVAVAFTVVRNVPGTPLSWLDSAV